MESHRPISISSFLAAAFAALASASHAQSDVTIYGRIDLSLAQQADAPIGKEVRNGSGNRLGVKGKEDLGGGLLAVFQLEHRFNSDDGTVSTARFWEGEAIVGLEGKFGRVTLGREETPAYTYSQFVADPFHTDTVAANGTIIKGRIGMARYSNAVTYRFAADGFSFGAQVAESDGNVSASGLAKNRPYSLGGAWTNGPIVLGVGYENPGAEHDYWVSFNGSYDFKTFKLAAFVGAGRTANDEKMRAYLISVTAPLGQGELRASFGQLKNAAADLVRDRQFSVGYHYALSKRTTLYTDVTHEGRGDMPDNLRSTGYDFGIKHTF